MDTTDNDVTSGPDTPLGGKGSKPEERPPDKQVQPVMHPGPGLQHPHKPDKR